MFRFDLLFHELKNLNMTHMSQISSGLLIPIFVLFMTIIPNLEAYLPRFSHGRPIGGLVGIPGRV